jgi:hypothetical protein
MEKIVTQDVYLPIKGEELPNNWNVLHDKGKRVVVNKKENMVVLTKEQYEADKSKTAEQAFIAGQKYMDGINRFRKTSEPTKEQYLNQLFK